MGFSGLRFHHPYPDAFMPLFFPVEQGVKGLVSGSVSTAHHRLGEETASSGKQGHSFSRIRHKKIPGSGNRRLK